MPSGTLATRCGSAIKKTLRYKERDPEARRAYLRTLRHRIQQQGSADIIYLDESGFPATTQREYGWAPKGRQVHGERSGNTRPRTSLIAGKRGAELLAPFLFAGSTNALWFNQWLSEHLFKTLRPQSTRILDNAAFHKKTAIHAMAEQAGHQALFLPPYSPDFNAIEHDFAVIKKQWANAPPHTTLDDIIKSYGNYLA